jgi:hypothetical protein
MLITTELLLQSHQRFFFLNLLMVGISSVLFLTLQRRMLSGAMSGGRSVGGALSRMKIGGSGGGGGSGSGSDGWTRVTSSGYTPIDRYQQNRRAKAAAYRATLHVTQAQERVANRHKWIRRITRRSE